VWADEYRPAVQTALEERIASRDDTAALGGADT
jgi:hypothetical protein